MACFSESTSRFVLSVAPDRVDEVTTRAAAAGVPVATVGHAAGTRLVAAGTFAVDLAAAAHAYRDAIPTIMGAVRV